MLMEKRKTKVFTVNLGREAHQIADKFCQEHPEFTKAKQVYRNSLAVKDKGRLACCCVMPGDDWVQLSEDMLDSLCCVAVDIDGEMKRAKLLGFTDNVTEKKVFVSELRPIYELPEYLRKCEFGENHNPSENKFSASYVKSVKTD